MLILREWGDKGWHTHDDNDKFMIIWLRDDVDMILKSDDSVLAAIRVT